MHASTGPDKWWKDCVLYQIYPASFKDSNGDGIGDLAGIISKLPYLKKLGINAIWISPFYKSPQHDMGYDISDYQDIAAQYGTLKDMDDLLAAAHKLDIRVLADLVINHTSSEHRWFKESASSRDNPKADWYIWRDAKLNEAGERMPPNNWKSIFGNGSCWEWCETRQQYYLHYFVVQQPDLNWENPETRKAIYEEAVLFWLKRGIDGFRIDTSNMYSKFLDFPDMPIIDPHSSFQLAEKYYCNGPRLHEFLKELNKEAFRKYDIVTIGECPCTPDFHGVLPFIQTHEEELDMVIQFDLASIDHEHGLFPRKWDLKTFKDITIDAQRLCEPEHAAWACTYLENHDQARCVTRFGSDLPEHRVVSAKMLAIYLLCLSGVPIIYQGQECGMINIQRDDKWDIRKEYLDIQTQGFLDIIEDVRQKDLARAESGFTGIELCARDHARVPVAWSSEENGGFSSSAEAVPWMRAPKAYTEINIESQMKESGSVWSFYQKLIDLRKHQYHKVMTYGQFAVLDYENTSTFSFSKSTAAEKLLVTLNFTDKAQPVFKKGFEQALLLFSAVDAPDGKMLAPYEGRVYHQKS